MADQTTVTLSGDAARRLARLMQSGAYPSAEAAIADALATLEDAAAPDIDAWLRDVVAERYDAHASDPARAIPLDEARKRIFGTPQK